MNQRRKKAKRKKLRERERESNLPIINCEKMTNILQIRN